MEISWRGLVTVGHGMLFGGFFLLALFGALVELWRTMFERETAVLTSRGQLLEKIYLWKTAVLGWVAVLTGTYVVYPWYRAVPPKGTTDLTLYPKQVLLASAATAGWHNFGMEWKEHVAWLAPIAVTMVAYVWTQYRSEVREHRQIRSAVLVFAMVALLAAGIAGGFGAMINKYAPVQGGRVVRLMGEGK
jgi:hypothetical protein